MSDERSGHSTLAVLLGFLMLAVTVWAFTWRLTTDSWQAELVRRGHARWVITSDQGQSKWEWIEK